MLQCEHVCSTWVCNLTLLGLIKMKPLASFHIWYVQMLSKVRGLILFITGNYLWLKCSSCLLLFFLVFFLSNKWRHVNIYKNLVKNISFSLMYLFIFLLIFRVCHMNPDPTCNSCFAEDGLSDSHSIMTSSVASSYQSIPCSTVSVFATAANTPIQ